jgi:hypothetical protein
MVGASTRQLQELRVNDRVFLMGPAGSKLSIPKDHRVLILVDPQAPVGIVNPVMHHLSNETHQLIASLERVTPLDFKGFDSVFVVGTSAFIKQFIAAFPSLAIPVYTHVHAHLQCMMKQVCAQCVYTTKEPETGVVAVQFGCAKSIENLQNFSYSDVNKRNKNERMEETLLARWAAIYSTHN